MSTLSISNITGSPIVNDSKKKRIIVLRGTPKINDKDLSFLKVGNVSAGKEINLDLNFDDRILILEEI